MRWRGGRRGGTVEDRRPNAAERSRRDDIKSALGPSREFQDTQRLKHDTLSWSRELEKKKTGLRPGRTYTMGRS